MEEMLWPEGLKRTKQREDVFKVLLHAKEPMTANDIYRTIEKEEGGCSYAVSTIYRTLTVFEEKGCLEKSTLLGDDMAVYMLKRFDHQHYAVCIKCHKIIPLKKCPFNRMRIMKESSQEDFVVTGHRLELYGYCKECNKEQDE